MYRAPWWPSSPGWNMKRTVPGSSRAARVQQAGRADEHRGVRVVTARVHAAVDLARELEPGVLGHRQRVHVAAQQHDRTVAALRGRRPPTTPIRPVRTSRPEAVDRVEHDGLRVRAASVRARACDGCAGGARPASGSRRSASASSSADPFGRHAAEPNSVLRETTPAAPSRTRPRRRGTRAATRRPRPRPPRARAAAADRRGRARARPRP